MNDVFDQASDREMMDRDLAIASIRSKVNYLKPKGSCYFCDEPLSSRRKFCGPNCRDDFEREERQKRNR